MSGAALSSAKQRRSVLKDARGNPLANQNPSPQSQPYQNQTQNQTPQVIPVPQALAMFDRRINMLEQTVKNMMQTQNTPAPLIVPNSDNNQSEEIRELKEAIHRLDEMVGNNANQQDIIEDMHTFATELDNLKNTIIKLQTYTMDVNRMLLEDRGKKQETLTHHMDGIIIEESA